MNIFKSLRDSQDVIRADTVTGNHTLDPTGTFFTALTVPARLQRRKLMGDHKVEMANVKRGTRGITTRVYSARSMYSYFEKLKNEAMV